MPLNYFSPDGWFASNIRTVPASGIQDGRGLVHKKGIKVVMDVVYNHSSGNSSFERMCPDYYFRKKPDGTFWNGSGCGNEYQSEYPMARKYIIDSLKTW